ncbi:hypothetical protein M3210_03105 [Oceanobacillus luteolus]|uniref:hypothetical protein n=1 Tax=Oceanobacillus luteolus TaxID=1274358 RepID=UPI00203A81DB|nr:hypothetical protein [Oceanobacillus luteolus]MCM3739252.1 hypothetical protein [Oceanobacillus luteolus]
MNKVALALNVVGALAILGGIIVGFSSYQEPLPGYTYITEENYSVLFTWIGVGLISGIMMFGFAEIINLLDKIKMGIYKDSNKSGNEKEPGKATKYIEEILNKK